MTTWRCGQCFRRSDGCCKECGITIRAGNGPRHDHRIPDALGGRPALDHCAVLCSIGLGARTARLDVPQIARAAAHKGVWMIFEGIGGHDPVLRDGLVAAYFGEVQPT